MTEIFISYRRFCWGLSRNREVFEGVWRRKSSGFHGESKKEEAEEIKKDVNVRVLAFLEGKGRGEKEGFCRLWNIFGVFGPAVAGHISNGQWEVGTGKEVKFMNGRLRSSWSYYPIEYCQLLKTWRTRCQWVFLPGPWPIVLRVQNPIEGWKIENFLNWKMFTYEPLTARLSMNPLW